MMTLLLQTALISSILCLRLVAGSEVEEDDQVARFDYFRVYRVDVASDYQLKVLRTLENGDASASISFWRLPHQVNSSADVMVAPSHLQEFNDVVNWLGMRARLIIKNVQDLVDVERKSRGNLFGWNQYNSLDQIYKWMDSLEQSWKPTVSVFSAGPTYQGRKIKGVKISYKSGNPGIFIESNVHGREWIAAASALWIINELLSSRNSAIRDIAENIDWYVIPVANPDGYVFSMTKNRLWRKTRKPYGPSGCIGVDPNRNWSFKWLNGGSSTNPCSEVYAGPKPFSEPETIAIANFFHSIASNITAYLDFHSYGQVLIYPYGVSDVTMNNLVQHNVIAQSMVIKLAQRYGTKYDFGEINKLMGLSSGGSVDWVKGIYNTPLTFVWEMRDAGRYGFLLPADQIVPNAAETLDSIVEMVRVGRRMGYFKRK